MAACCLAPTSTQSIECMSVLVSSSSSPPPDEVLHTFVNRCMGSIDAMQASRPTRGCLAVGWCGLPLDSSAQGALPGQQGPGALLACSWEAEWEAVLVLSCPGYGVGRDMLLRLLSDWNTATGRCSALFHSSVHPVWW